MAHPSLYALPLRNPTAIKGWGAENRNGNGQEQDLKLLNFIMFINFIQQQVITNIILAQY